MRPFADDCSKQRRCIYREAALTNRSSKTWLRCAGHSKKIEWKRRKHIVNAAPEILYIYPLIFRVGVTGRVQSITEISVLLPVSGLDSDGPIVVVRTARRVYSPYLSLCSYASRIPSISARTALPFFIFSSLVIQQERYE